MKLNIKDWKEFKMELLFDIHAGRYHYKNEYSSGLFLSIFHIHLLFQVSFSLQSHHPYNIQKM